MTKISDVSALMIKASQAFEDIGAGGTYKAIANSLALIDPESRDLFWNTNAQPQVQNKKAHTLDTFISLAAPSDGITEDDGCDSCGSSSDSIISSSEKGMQAVTPSETSKQTQEVIDTVQESPEGASILVDDLEGDVVNNMLDAEMVERSVDLVVTEQAVEQAPRTMTQDIAISDGIKAAEKVAYTSITKKTVMTEAKLVAQFSGNLDLLKKWAMDSGMQVKFLKGDTLVKKVYQLLPAE